MVIIAKVILHSECRGEIQRIIHLVLCFLLIICNDVAYIRVFIRLGYENRLKPEDFTNLNGLLKCNCPIGVILFIDKR